MQLVNAPSKIVLPFAASGSKRTVPVVSSGTPGSASYTNGFPPETMQPVSAGGIPPSGLDFNGLFNAISALSLWYNSGTGFPYDAAFSTAVGGYPKGSRVVRAGGVGYWLSTVDDNTTNPDAGGAGWRLDGGNAISSVYASAQQSLAVGASKILYNTVEFDSQSQWNAGSQRFVAQWAGNYRLSGATYLPAPAGQLIAADVYKNGVLAKRCSEYPQVSDAGMSYPFNAVIAMAVGDYAEAFLNIAQTIVSAGQAGSNQAFVYSQFEYLGV